MEKGRYQQRLQQQLGDLQPDTFLASESEIFKRHISGTNDTAGTPPLPYTGDIDDSIVGRRGTVSYLLTLRELLRCKQSLASILTHLLMITNFWVESYSSFSFCDKLCSNRDGDEDEDEDANEVTRSRLPALGGDEVHQQN